MVTAPTIDQERFELGLAQVDAPDLGVKVGLRKNRDEVDALERLLIVSPVTCSGTQDRGCRR
jgi:hypothetical protein